MMRNTQAAIVAAKLLTNTTFALAPVDAAAPAQPEPRDGAPAPAATPSSDAERLTAVEGKVDGLTESQNETRTDVERMDKLRFNGYVQGRFEYHADSERGVDPSGKPTQTSMFLVRRARLKATYIEPWTSWNLRLTPGQFKGS